MKVGGVGARSEGCTNV